MVYKAILHRWKMNKAKIDRLPRPMWALTPPRFLTRNRPDFLKAQLRVNPKSDSKTQVGRPSRHVPPAIKIFCLYYTLSFKSNAPLKNLPDNAFTASSIKKQKNFLTKYNEKTFFITQNHIFCSLEILKKKRSNLLKLKLCSFRL